MKRQIEYNAQEIEIRKIIEETGRNEIVMKPKIGTKTAQKTVHKTPTKSNTRNISPLKTIRKNT